jgi:hypothetical protein
LVREQVDQQHLAAVAPDDVGADDLVRPGDIGRDVPKSGNGEWSTPRVLEVQLQKVKRNGLDQFKDTWTEVILEPAESQTGEVVALYSSVTQ